MSVISFLSGEFNVERGGSVGVRSLTLPLPFSHHVFAKTSHKEVQIAEVGPRFEAKRELMAAFRVLLTLSIRDSPGHSRPERGRRRVAPPAIHAYLQETQPALTAGFRLVALDYTVTVQSPRLRCGAFLVVLLVVDAAAYRGTEKYTEDMNGRSHGTVLLG
jgi:hypothetical protein